MAQSIYSLESQKNDHVWQTRLFCYMWNHDMVSKVRKPNVGGCVENCGIEMWQKAKAIFLKEAPNGLPN